MIKTKAYQNDRGRVGWADQNAKASGAKCGMDSERTLSAARLAPKRMEDRGQLSVESKVFNIRFSIL